MFTQLDQAPGYTLDRKYKAPLGVSSLFPSSGPTAIRRFVIPVVINSIKRKVLRTTSKIVEKFTEVTPTTTNTNTTSTITIKPGVVGIGTTLPHVTPRLVSPAAFIKNGVSVCQSTQPSSFFSVTSTRYDCTTAQVSIGGNEHRSTITSEGALSLGLPTGEDVRWGFSCNNSPSKTKSYEV